MSLAPTRKPRRRLSKAGLMFSLAFHAVLIGSLAWMAAREGLLGLPAKKVTVSLLRESPSEKPPVTEKPKIETPKANSVPFSAPVPTSKDIVASPVKTSTPTPDTTPRFAPPAVEMPAIGFDGGGQTVQTSTDPTELYRGYVEFFLRSRWNRPDDIDDAQFVAEIEIAVARNGRISEPRWKLKTGNARWDASVLDVAAHTRKLDRPPPPGFPPRVILRFDVLETGQQPAPNL